MTRAQVYTLFRKVHLYAGLSLFTFVLMYFVTGYPIIHHDWFDEGEPLRSERQADVSQPPGEPLKEYAVWLQDELGLAGKRTGARKLKDGRWKFEYWRPGTLHEVHVSADGATAHIATRQESWRTTLVGFHRMHNYGGGWLYDIWVVFYDLASASLIVFAFSGIYLWWRLTRRRLWGWICLGVSWGFAAVTVGYLMYAP